MDIQDLTVEAVTAGCIIPSTMNIITVLIVIIIIIVVIAVVVAYAAAVA